MDTPVSEAQIGSIFRQEYGRAVAVLRRVVGDLQMAEDSVQNAFVAALAAWPTNGVPPSPAGWIITTARRNAIDELRRQAVGKDKQVQAVVLRAESEPVEGPVYDDQLRLIFTCAHPALAMPSRVALTLRLLGGLTTTEVAAAFLVPEATMAQRLVRAKAKIKAARIPYRVPEESQLPDRLDGVLAVLYLIFNEGYAASTGDQLIRVDLCDEAIRLTRLLARLMPDQPEIDGLLALMLLSDARRAARTDDAGALIRLADQDRSQWDTQLVKEGKALVRRCLRRNRPGPYQIQAAINAVHCDARRAPDTEWGQIVCLYDQLQALDPSPIVALNRAVAVAEVAGPVTALRLLDDLQLDEVAMFHSVRADLLRRAGRSDEAVRAYERAMSITRNAAEREFLQRRRAELD